MTKENEGGVREVRKGLVKLGFDDWVAMGGKKLDGTQRGGTKGAWKMGEGERGK